ncbi:MAG: hypothetical protein IJN90_00240 [Bacilli bacterium]|nr:hypothetical protein [Bacilli bacterium]
MNRKNYLKTREKVLKTSLGKKTYRKLTMSTIILIISLLGLAIITTCLCNYFVKGEPYDNLELMFKLLPVCFGLSLLSGATTCFLSGEFNMLLKTIKKIKE